MSLGAIENVQVLAIIATVLAVAFLILLILHVRTEIRLHRLLKGKNAKTLEDTIHSLAQDVADLEKFESDMKKYSMLIEKRLNRSVQGIETVRFNPFKGTGGGGNQSFAISMINESGDGVILSSLHHREGVSVFSKPVAGFASIYELTEEEKESLEGAKQKVSQ